MKQNVSIGNSSRVALVLSLVWMLVLAGCGSSGSPAGEPVRIAAAASLTDVLEAQVKAGRQAGLPSVELVTAGSQTVARQVEGGMEADLVFLANPRWMDHLEAKDLLHDGTRVNRLANRLVLVVSRQRSPESDRSLEDRLRSTARLALGNPRAVPAGIYARQTLQNMGLWELVSDRVVSFPHVRAVLSAVAGGSAPLGIVYRTDVRRVDTVRVLHTFSDTVTPPIRYPLAMTATADESARRWYRWLNSPNQVSIYEQYGFIVLP